MTASPFDEVTPQLVATPFGKIDPSIHSISYLRVSTRAQAQRDGEPEGLSIPAQRAAVDFTAASQKQTAVRMHFSDKDASARSADRPGLKAMLEYLGSNKVDYVFVHKLDRLARNRHDDVMITMAIKKSGATLVSCSENIDDTPSGMLVHGIISSIAEYYSRNLSTESKRVCARRPNVAAPTAAHPSATATYKPARPKASLSKPSNSTPSAHRTPAGSSTPTPRGRRRPHLSPRNSDVVA
ncbi:MAG: recombinase family protein [Gordonia sp. (in: high G+C Gram-positive bacteria)]